MNDVNKLANEIITNRIPSFVNSKQWVTDMFNLGLTYHFDDNPADIISSVTNKALFSSEECTSLLRIVLSIDRAQYDALFDTLVELSND
jgi:hypothetical protein